METGERGIGGTGREAEAAQEIVQMERISMEKTKSKNEKKEQCRRTCKAGKWPTNDGKRTKVQKTIGTEGSHLRSGKGHGASSY